LRDVTSFTDFLVICSGTNPRQVQAISDEVEQQLKAVGERALNIEGYTHGEWILMDYGNFVVNVFSEKSRTYYDLERLWRDAKQILPKSA
jgi:ribosome-associated protein